MEAPQVLHNKKTILLVDDDATILRFVAGCLAVNYDILTAKSGEDALQQSKDFKSEIHLLLSDLQMEGITGIELATQITVQRPKIKVLLMSGSRQGCLCSMRDGIFYLSRSLPRNYARWLRASSLPTSLDSRLRNPT